MATAHSHSTWAGRRLHFVGIGGAGMSGLALIAAALGAQVSGSDRAPSSYTDRLATHGIEPVFGHAAANVPTGAEVVYSTAIPPDNPERQAAGTELHRADLLAQIAALRRCLAVTGTHGKTTTSAMAVQALQGAGLDPAYVVGGELGTTGSNAGWGVGGVDRGRGRRVRPLAAQAPAGDRRAHQRRARPSLHLCLAAGPGADLRHVHGARGGSRGGVGPAAVAGPVPRRRRALRRTRRAAGPGGLEL